MSLNTPRITRSAFWSDLSQHFDEEQRIFNKVNDVSDRLDDYGVDIEDRDRLTLADATLLVSSLDSIEKRESDDHLKQLLQARAKESSTGIRIQPKTPGLLSDQYIKKARHNQKILQSESADPGDLIRSRQDLDNMTSCLTMFAELDRRVNAQPIASSVTKSKRPQRKRKGGSTQSTQSAESSVVKVIKEFTKSLGSNALDVAVAVSRVSADARQWSEIRDREDVEAQWQEAFAADKGMLDQCSLSSAAALVWERAADYADERAGTLRYLANFEVGEFEEEVANRVHQIATQLKTLRAQRESLTAARPGFNDTDAIDVEGQDLKARIAAKQTDFAACVDESVNAVAVLLNHPLADEDSLDDIKRGMALKTLKDDLIRQVESTAGNPESPDFSMSQYWLNDYEEAASRTLKVGDTFLKGANYLDILASKIDPSSQGVADTKRIVADLVKASQPTSSQQAVIGKAAADLVLEKTDPGTVVRSMTASAPPFVYRPSFDHSQRVDYAGFTSTMTGWQRLINALKPRYTSKAPATEGSVQQLMLPVPFIKSRDEYFRGVMGTMYGYMQVLEEAARRDPSRSTMLRSLGAHVVSDMSKTRAIYNNVMASGEPDKRVKEKYSKLSQECAQAADTMGLRATERSDRFHEETQKHYDGIRRGVQLAEEQGPDDLNLQNLDDGTSTPSEDSEISTDTVDVAGLSDFEAFKHRCALILAGYGMSARPDQSSDHTKNKVTSTDSAKVPNAASGPVEKGSSSVAQSQGRYVVPRPSGFQRSGGSDITPQSNSRNKGKERQW